MIIPLLTSALRFAGPLRVRVPAHPHAQLLASRGIGRLLHRVDCI